MPSAFARVNATNHYHALQIADFLRAIRESRPPLVTGADGRAVVQLFTAIYQSSRERRAVALGGWPNHKGVKGSTGA